MQAQTATSETISQPSIVEAMTFYVTDNLYAIEIAHVLSISERLDAIQAMPVKCPGLLGVSNFQGAVVPVFNLAHRLNGRSGQESKQELVTLLEQREQDHIAWLEELERCIETGEPFSKATDPHKCAFGKWYDNFKTRDASLAEIMKEFDEPHRHIHSLAEKLVTKAANGYQKEALEELNAERHTTLHRLQGLFHQAREQIRSIIRPVVLYVTFDGVAPKYGLVVDEINDVMRFKMERFQTSDQIGLNLFSSDPSLIKGILVSDDEQNVAWFDVSRMIADNVLKQAVN